MLVLLAVAVPGAPHGRLSRTGDRGVRLAVTLAAAWLPLALVTSMLRFADFAGARTSSPALGAQYLDHLVRFPIGRAEFVALVATAALATALPLVRTLTGVAGAALLALVALVPLAATGHASAGDFGESATVTLAVHLMATAIWVGGLLGLLLLRGVLGDQSAVVAQRFSRLAAVCWALVAATGLANLALALHDVSDLLSVWGAALVTKVVLLLVLGAFGWWHRRSTLPRLALDAAAFRSWAMAEVLLMAATLGVAVGVTASAPPPIQSEDRQLLDMPWVLLGFPAPMPLTPERWLTAGRLDLLWAATATALAMVYLLGVLRLRREHTGAAWPGRRAAAWLAGCSVLAYATSGAPGLYGRVDYSASVAQVLLLALGAAPLLAAGRPGTLLELSVPAREDESRGAREWVALAVRSPVVERLSRPTVALALLVAVVLGMSFDPLVEAGVRSWPGHSATVALALAAGLLLERTWAGEPLGRAPHGPSPRQSLAVLAGVLAASAAVAGLRPAPAAAAWYAQVMPSAGTAAPDGTGLLDAAELLASQARGAAVVWAVAALAGLAAALIVRGRHPQADRETGQHR